MASDEPEVLILLDAPMRYAILNTGWRVNLERALRDEGVALTSMAHPGWPPEAEE